MSPRLLPVSTFGATRLILVCAFALLCLLGLPACVKKTENGFITGKEHIPAAPATGEVKDERQVSHERWMVEFTLENGRRGATDVEKPQWDELKVGDRVRVRYSEGEYSHTIWATELEKI